MDPGRVDDSLARRQGSTFPKRLRLESRLQLCVHLQSIPRKQDGKGVSSNLADVRITWMV